jgi:hypothetical protein
MAPTDTVTLLKAEYEALINVPTDLLADILAGRARKTILTAILHERNRRIGKGLHPVSEAEVSEAGKAIPASLFGDLACALLVATPEDAGAILAEKHVSEERESRRKHYASTATKKPVIKQAPDATTFVAGYIKERTAQEAAAKGAAGAAKSAGARSAGGRASDAE